MHFLEAAGRHWKFNRLKIGRKSINFHPLVYLQQQRKNDEDADTILSLKTSGDGTVL